MTNIRQPASCGQSTCTCALRGVRITGRIRHGKTWWTSVAIDWGGFEIDGILATLEYVEWPETAGRYQFRLTNANVKARAEAYILQHVRVEAAGRRVAA